MIDSASFEMKLYSLLVFVYNKIVIHDKISTKSDISTKMSENPVEHSDFLNEMAKHREQKIVAGDEEEIEPDFRIRNSMLEWCDLPWQNGCYTCGFLEITRSSTNFEAWLETVAQGQAQYVANRKPARELRFWLMEELLPLNNVQVVKMKELNRKLICETCCGENGLFEKFGRKDKNE